MIHPSRFEGPCDVDPVREGGGRQMAGGWTYGVEGEDGRGVGEEFELGEDDAA